MGWEPSYVQLRELLGASRTFQYKAQILLPGRDDLYTYYSVKYQKGKVIIPLQGFYTNKQNSKQGKEKGKCPVIFYFLIKSSESRPLSTFWFYQKGLLKLLELNHKMCFYQAKVLQKIFLKPR